MADELGRDAELEPPLHDGQLSHQHVLDGVVPEPGEDLVEGALVHPDGGQVPQDVLHRPGPLPVRDFRRLGDGPEQGCQISKFDPFLSLDCARVEGVGAQSKERKGSNFAA